MSSAQATSSLAADAPRYGVGTADAYYVINQPGTPASQVNQIIAGNGITITSTGPGGTGNVTIQADPAQNVTSVNGETGNISFQSTDGSVVVSTPGTGLVNLAVPTSIIQRSVGVPNTGNPSSFLPQVGQMTIDLSGSSVTTGNYYSWSVSFRLSTSQVTNPAVADANSVLFVSLEGLTYTTGSLVNTLSLVAIPLQQLVANTYVSGGVGGSATSYNYSGYGKALATGNVKLAFNVTNFNSTSLGNQIAASSIGILLTPYTELNLAPILIA